MMTPRERWLAAVRLQPVDRLPFWPKLSAAYPRAQAAPFSGLSLPELHAWIGSDPHEFVGGILREVRSRTSLETREADGVRDGWMHTPYGTLHSQSRWDEGSQSWHPVEHPVKTADDLPALQAWFDDVQIELNEDALARVTARVANIGESASTAASVGESPLMEFVEWYAGIETAHFLLADATEAVEAVFASMHRVLLRNTEITAAHHPADLLYFIENTSTTLISPAQYRAYSLPQVGAYTTLAAQAGRDVVLHMCGHLKALLPDIATLPARAYEAFTSPTLGNTTLLDGRTACPDVCLVGGTNAMLWTRPATEIIAQLQADLDALPHTRGIVVTSAGVMPPLATPETIRDVCAWVQQYPVRQ